MEHMWKSELLFLKLEDTKLKKKARDVTTTTTLNAT